MLTQKFRPNKFIDVVGQDLAKELLQAIVKKPENSPKSIILQGDYGLGKTTCSRIFAKALNCRNKTKTGDVCGTCDVCLCDIDKTMYYDEYDSALIGNVENIKELQETFYFDKSLGFKVILFDEFHLASTQAQSTLLKMIEESTDNIFYLFCTTNSDKILPTIQSRSLKIKFNLIPPEQLRLNLERISKEENINISPNSLNLVVDRSKGHARDAVMLLDEFRLLGEDKFGLYLQSSKELYYKLFLASCKRDLESVVKIINTLLNFPLYILKQDYEDCVLDIIKVSLGVKKTDNKFLAFLVSLYKDRIFILLNVLNETKIYDMFTSDKRFQTAMYIIVKEISNQFNK